jgi:hypothetical protein
LPESDKDVSGSAQENDRFNQLSAKTANRDLKALKMMVKSARRDSIITEDPTEFVEPVRLGALDYRKQLLVDRQNPTPKDNIVLHQRAISKT